MAKVRLAIVVSHPIQYYAPWFTYLAAHLDAEIRVFYLWNFGVTVQMDRDFGCAFRWDVDLLDGYEHEFVPNRASDPGTHHFSGLDNPGLVDALCRWRPDAVLLFGYRYLSHLRLLLSPRLRRVKFIFRGDSHLLAETSPRVLKRILLRLLFRRFHAFLSVGLANTDYFLRHGVSPRAIFHAPHAVDHNRFCAATDDALAQASELRARRDLPEHQHLILFVGKFERKKRPDELARAFLQAKFPKTILLLVGGGAMETELRQIAQGHPEICFLPFQNQSALPGIYALADLLVLPSFGPGETWGLVVNEAFWAGKPAILSDHVGCHRDLLRHGKNGLRFPAGDQAALTRSLREAFADPMRLKQWGAESRKLIAGFSYVETTEGLRKALAAVLPNHRIS